MPSGAFSWGTHRALGQQCKEGWRERELAFWGKHWWRNGRERSCLTFWACSDTQREISLPSGEGWGGPILPHCSLSLHCPCLFLKPAGWGLQCMHLFSPVSAAGASSGCVCQSWVILLWEGKNIHCKPHPEHHWSGRTTRRNQENEWFIKGNFDPCHGCIKDLLSFWLAGETGHVDKCFSHLILHYLSHSERVSVFENVLSWEGVNGLSWEERKYTERWCPLLL